MSWWKSNWDRVLSLFVTIVGGGGVLAFLNDFTEMWVNYPWQAASLTGLAFGLGMVLARTATRLSQEERFQRKRVKDILLLSPRQRALLGIAIDNGEVMCNEVTSSIGGSLMTDGYLVPIMGGKIGVQYYVVPRGLRERIRRNKGVMNSINEATDEINPTWGYV